MPGVEAAELTASPLPCACARGLEKVTPVPVTKSPVCAEDFRGADSMRASLGILDISMPGPILRGATSIEATVTLSPLISKVWPSLNAWELATDNFLEPAAASEVRAAAPDVPIFATFILSLDAPAPT